jgi:hypothetical protein
MSYCGLRNDNQCSLTDEARRFDRLRKTCAMQGGAFERWQAGSVGVVGCGVLGSRLLLELIRSGIGRCLAFDADTVSAENLGTQCYTKTGIYKTDAIRDQCDSIRPGVLQSRPIDVRHAGIGELAALDAIVDATDDPNLQLPLTEISNGLRIPILRIAVDGSGEKELGRVQFSHGGGGCACFLCSKSIEDVSRAWPRTHCPQARLAADGSPPTLAGAGISMAVGGVGLVQLQRLIGGKLDGQALYSQIFIDLDNNHIVAFSEVRSEICISGHVAWDITHAGVDAAQVTFGEMFDMAGQICGWPVDVLEPYRHAFCLSARCECGEAKAAIGTRWATAPRCDKCGRDMSWELHIQKSTWSFNEAKDANILSRRIVELGLPNAGAMFLAKRQSRPTKRIVLS